jgi:hypothetical protein
MRLSTIVAPILVAAGCQEYAIGDNVPPVGEANPVELDNPVNVDKIVQVTTPSVDVLWIVDNSCSMDGEQRQLAENFPAFMPYFLGSGLDYHIGVVSTDMVDPQQKGKLIAADNGDKWIDVDSDNPEAMFQQMSQLGTSGDGLRESGRGAGYTALELFADSFNQGFLRDDRGAGIHVIVVSDEVDGTPANVITKDEFIDWMNDLRPDDDALATFSSIVNPPDVGPVQAPGTDYLYLTDGIGGIKWPIHSPDWITVLEQLAIQAAGLKREYFLSQLPVRDTIEVQVTQPDPEGGPPDTITDATWKYSVPRNSITFDTFIPLPLSEVHIGYTVLSSMVDTVEEVDTKE